jgi:hypothetical protein
MRKSEAGGFGPWGPGACPRGNTVSPRASSSNPASQFLEGGQQ